MSIKLVALDLDGTIVNDRLEVSERTIKLLKHLINNTSVKVVIATGRMFLSALSYAKIIGVCEPVIAYQGAMIRDIKEGHTLIEHTPIPLALAHDVLKVLATEKFSTNLYVDDQLYTSHNNPHATFYARLAGVTPIFSHDLVTSLVAPPTKMMAIDDDRIDYLLNTLNEAFPQRLTFCKSRTNFCEIIDSAASKWNAIQTLAKGWGIQPDEIMAVGDQCNDLSMITHAGIGVAMGNAPDEVKEVANYITKPISEDGAAEAIEKFVLGNLPLKDA